ncbi:MAG: bifunctional folylpolyglutamate synthase/dihydrofolate synthase [Tannerella sp.]|jgi:dihydrofolate synthase/folylpolyglutamate synthase|nr:bifunctional folylpolyglutamate synthase/dihydrofolate synthase [Tannerella sp.]
MTYEKTLNFLYSATPAFHKAGGVAYKPGPSRSILLDNITGNPHKDYKIIHIAGTNGKGSVSHLLANILTEARCKVGLYTSPHVVDVCERIRVNGKTIPKRYVSDFIKRYYPSIKPFNPSFFELITSMAFEFFRYRKIDVAIIETGLGGRLDSTNIVNPILSIITNISIDHTQYLGESLSQIAFEKAGIIKPNVPVLIGEVKNREVRHVFTDKAKTVHAPLFFAEEMQVLSASEQLDNGLWRFYSQDYGTLENDMPGMFQEKNAQTVLSALKLLRDMRFKIPSKAVEKGFETAAQSTGLMGRWQTLRNNPLIICDIGHNAGAWEYLGSQLQKCAKTHSTLRMVVGMVNDKKISDVLSLMPADASYYFTQASVERALPAADFAAAAEQCGLKGQVFDKVTNAVLAALKDSQPNDMIFIGGSTFVVADAIPLFMNI